MPSDIGYPDAWSDDGAFAPAGGDGYGAGPAPGNRLLGDGSAYGGGSDPYAAGLGLPDLSLSGDSSGAGAARGRAAASGAGADPYSLSAPTPPNAGGWSGGAGGDSFSLGATPPSPTDFGAGDAATALGGAGGPYGGGFGLPAPVAPDAADGGWSDAGPDDGPYSLRAAPPSPTDFSPSAVAALGGAGGPSGGGSSLPDLTRPDAGAGGGASAGPADPVGAALVVHGILQPAIGSVLGAPPGTLTRDGVVDQIGDTLDRVRRSGALTPAQWMASVGRCVDLANGLPDDDAGIRAQVAGFHADHSAAMRRVGAGAVQTSAKASNSPPSSPAQTNSPAQSAVAQGVRKAPGAQYDQYNSHLVSVSPWQSFVGQLEADFYRGTGIVPAHALDFLVPTSEELDSGPDDGMRNYVFSRAAKLLQGTQNVIGGLTRPLLPDNDDDAITSQIRAETNRAHPFPFDPYHVFSQQDRRDALGGLAFDVAGAGAEKILGEAAAKRVAQGVLPHGELAPTLRGTGKQAHHLGQARVFRDIPYEDGLSIGLEGDAITDPTSQHGRFHDYMDSFFDQFGKDGDRAGQVPKHWEYTEATEDALVHAGLSRRAARAVAGKAADQREALLKLKPYDEIPLVPPPIRQSYRRAPVRRPIIRW